MDDNWFLFETGGEMARHFCAEKRQRCLPAKWAGGTIRGCSGVGRVATMTAFWQGETTLVFPEGP